MKVTPTPIDGILIIDPDVHGDDRGFFLESWNEGAFEAAGIAEHFVQDNHSRSSRGVLRGLHYQLPNPQGKLVRVASGAVFDVAVDLRESSTTFGRWFGVELSAQNKRMLWVATGMAHGFLTLEDNTDFLYKCTDFYRPECEHVLNWDDPAVGVEWPIDVLTPLLSPKDDSAGKALADCAHFP